MSDYYIRDVILAQSRRLGRLAMEKLLAGFTEIDDEAERVSQQAWEKWNSGFPTDDDDPGAAAQYAEDLGLEHYMALTNLRQATLNLLAAQLFHLFEQHFRLYVVERRRNHARFVRWNEPEGSSVLPSAATIAELRLVANTAKHGDGRETEELKRTHPRLFVDPILAKFTGIHPAEFNARAPFAGDGLFVTQDDLQRYQAAIESIWEELACYHSAHTIEP